MTRPLKFLVGRPLGIRCRKILPIKRLKPNDRSLPAKHLLESLKWKIKKAPGKLEVYSNTLGRQYFRKIRWEGIFPNLKMLKVTKSLTRLSNLFSPTRFQCSNYQNQKPKLREKERSKQCPFPSAKRGIRTKKGVASRKSANRLTRLSLAI